MSRRKHARGVTRNRRRRGPLKTTLFICTGLLLLLVAWLLAEAVLQRALGGATWPPHGGKITLPRRNHPLGRNDPFREFIREGRLGVYVNRFYWVLLPRTWARSNGGVTYRTNEQGYRWRPFKPHPPRRVWRIVAMGDSNFFGWEVPRKESFPARLEAALRRRLPGRPIEVINAGIPGHTSKQGLIHLMTQVLDLQPDILLIGYGWNDSTHPLPYIRYGHEILMRGGDRWLQASLRLPQTYLARGLAQILLRLAFPRLRKHERKTVQNLEGPQTNPEPHAAVLPYYKENLRRMIELAREHHALPVLVPISAPPDFLAEQRQLARSMDVPLLETEPILEQAFRTIDNGELADRPEAPPQASPEERTFRHIRRSKRLFVDDCHPSAEVHRIIVNHVAPKLVPLVEASLDRP
jgi:lysophospholipase L1-like esterase